MVFAAAFLGGITGFGYALAAAPLLLLIGFPLRIVVTANLAITGITRLAVAYRFRRHVARGRAATLAVSSVPGLYLGARLLAEIPEATIKLMAGCAVMVSVGLLARSLDRPPPPPVRGAPVVAGFVGGFLGGSTSLSGIGPILLLARDKAAPTAFLADLAVYFVCSSALGLALLLVEGALVPSALVPTMLVWLPGALAGNVLGTMVGPRLPERLFRRLVLAVLFVAGATTAATALGG